MKKFPKCCGYGRALFSCMEKWAIVSRKEMTGHFGEASLFMVHIKLYAKVKHLFTLIALYLSKSLLCKCVMYVFLRIITVALLYRGRLGDIVLTFY